MRSSAAVRILAQQLRACARPGMAPAQACSAGRSRALHHLDIYIAAFADSNGRSRRAGAHPRHPAVRGRHRDPAGAHAPARRRGRGRAPRRDHGAQGRTRPRQCAAAVGAANHRVLGGRRQRAGHPRRHHARRRRAVAAARARVRQLARAGQGAGHGARGRGAARRRRRLLDAADDAGGPRRSRPRAAPSAAARCCGCATSAGSSASSPSSTPGIEKLAATWNRCAP